MDHLLPGVRDRHHSEGRSCGRGQHLLWRETPHGLRPAVPGRGRARKVREQSNDRKLVQPGAHFGGSRTKWRCVLKRCRHVGFGLTRRMVAQECSTHITLLYE